MKHAALATILAVSLVAPLSAQQPAPRDTSRHQIMDHPMPAQGMRQGMGRMGSGGEGMKGCSMMQGGMMHDSAMGGMMEGMMRGMAGSAEHVLASKTALQLTADQERRITALRDAARSAHDAALGDARRHQRELDEVMQAAAPDTAAVKMHFNGAQSAMGEAHLAVLRSAALTRAVLTDAQRHQFDSLQTAMGCGMMGDRGAQQPAHRH
jgi:hypothetical protein